MKPNYLSRYNSAIRASQQFTSTGALQKIGATLNRFDFQGVCDEETFDTDTYWECVLRYFAVTVYHPVSTCRMGGPGDPSAVVDPQLRCGIISIEGAVVVMMYGSCYNIM